MKILGKIFATVSLLVLIPSNILAYPSSYSIGATVKISICGDGIVEGEEECEKNLNQIFNCIDFGYQPDSIACDNSCAYDLLNCRPIEQPIVNIKTDINQITQEKTESLLPRLMILWDENNDGKLELEEFAMFISNWVDSWKSFTIIPNEKEEKISAAESCDINADKACNVIDFSIILYYLNNE